MRKSIASATTMLAARTGLGMALGLAFLAWPSASVAVFIRAASGFLLLDGLLALLSARRAGPGSAGRFLLIEGLWSLSMAIAVWQQPIFSILTLSFVLELQLILWLAGVGMLGLARWASGSPSSWIPGLLATAAALGLHFSPGAGAVDRRLILGIVFILYALGHFLGTSHSSKPGVMT